MSRGEVMFKIPGWSVNKLTGTTGTFYIRLRHGNDTSLLYQGKLTKV